jgi:hypothetical protein
MHFHLPKPLHGWREFAGEVGIIVLGVLIALGFEQVVVTIQERIASDQARKSVQAEITKNLEILLGRAELQTCLDRKLDDIGELLRGAGEGTPKPHPNWVSRPTFWFLATGNWQAATAAGRAALLSKGDQIRFGTFFAMFDFINREEEREQTAWAHLRGLEDWTGPLGPTARFGFTQALQDARYSNYRIKAETMILVDGMRAAGIPLPAPSAAHTNAICIPITTARPVAEAMTRSASRLGDPR